MAEHEEFLAAINQLAATFRVKLSDPATEGYWSVLENIPKEHIWAAVKEATASEQFMPPPATLRRYAYESAKIELLKVQPKALPAMTDGLRMGREVSVARLELQAEGWCWLCSMGEAIHRVGIKHRHGAFDWRRERGPGHRCDCSRKFVKPAPSATHDSRLPREPDEDEVF